MYVNESLSQQNTPSAVGEFKDQRLWMNEPRCPERFAFQDTFPFPAPFWCCSFCLCFFFFFPRRAVSFLKSAFATTGFVRSYGPRQSEAVGKRMQITVCLVGVWALSPMWLTPDTASGRLCIKLAKHIVVLSFSEGKVLGAKTYRASLFTFI